MPLKDLTRAAVLRAIAEYDRRTGQVFLSTHGYSTAKRYWLHHDGKRYPSKAIAGVAHGYLRGRSNLASIDFSGGAERVVPILRSLGFTVVDEHASVTAEVKTSRSFGTSLPSGRVWITSFWGFNPEGDGYLGFTREGDRAWFLRQWQAGDLVMVYATMGESTEAALRGRVMGFLEIEPTPIRDVDRMSPAGLKWKIETGVADRWTYAVPVVAAWRATDLPLARGIAPVTLGPGANWQLIASRGSLLTPAEATTALSINLQPVDVYGQALLSDAEKGIVYVPSRGFPMGFGKRSFEMTDGPRCLYVLQLDGEVGAIMGEESHLLKGKIVVKVGLAKDPQIRCGQHNACLPPAAKLRWKELLRSRPFPNGDAALAAETALKARFRQCYRSLGGEFFLCDERTLATEFAKIRR